MAAAHASLGRCPRCAATIPAASLLIEYEAEDGTRQMFVECPECDAVVKPDRKP